MQHDSKCWATIFLIVGAVIMANAYQKLVDPWLLVGGLMVVKGAILFFMPVCPCMKAQCASAPKNGKKK